jgi:microcystin-dependent protein
MAGTIPISLTQQFDNQTFLPLSGGKVYFIQAGTTSTPQNAFQDNALTIPYPNPYTLDASGRIPQLFFADGTIKIRIVNSAGVQQFIADNILVMGPTSGGGGGGSVDPTTVLQTGDIKMVYGTGSLTGFVRANGRTIGNASSGASERANSDTESLFAFLWTVDSNLTVSGGRGISAAADYAANKTITLPDFRGRAPYGDDAMGASAANRLTSSYFGAASALGAVGGDEKTALTSAGQLPSHQHDVFLKDPGHKHSSGWGLNGLGYTSGGAGPPAVTGGNDTGNATTGITIGSVSGTANDNKTAATGSGTAFATASPGIIITVYLKL